MDEPDPNAIRTVISALGLQADPYTPTPPHIRHASKQTGKPANYNRVYIIFE